MSALPHAMGRAIIFTPTPTYSSLRLSTPIQFEKHRSAPRYIMHMAEVAFLTVASASHTTEGSGNSNTTNTRASTRATMLGVSRFRALNEARFRSRAVASQMPNVQNSNWSTTVNSIMYRTPVSGKRASRSGRPTNPVLPNTKQNMKMRSLSWGSRSAFERSHVTAMTSA